MEDAKPQSLDPFAPIQSTGDRAVELHNLTVELPSPKDERIVSTNPTSGASRNAKNQHVTAEASGTHANTHQFNASTPQEQGYYYAGYENNSGNWNEHSNYVAANNLNVIPPAIYNDNSSLFYPPGYGFDSQMTYGQYSPLASPLSPIMFDGQMFSHQMPYYQPPISPGPPHVTSAFPASQNELRPSGNSSQENLMDNAFFGSGSPYYYLPFGSNEPLSSRSNSLDTGGFISPLTSGTLYHQPIGIHGQAPYQGFGLTANSSTRHFAQGSSYKNPIGSSFNHSRFFTDKGGRRERDRDTFNMSTDISSYRNRGPRASKPKNTSSSEESSSAGVKDVESISRIHINSPDFITDYERARFFVIKSFREDNIHKSIKYSVWASTPLGNRKLDSAYRESRDMEGICPVFLLFSVNASGQFYGVAEMIGHVDFENDADYWQQDRWSGQFPVKWGIIKDVPNNCFRHILLENNDNKPVTHSRDSQEVKLEHGVEMLKIFKSHDPDTSLLDDFSFYDEREKTSLERKAKHRNTAATESINQLSDNLVEALKLDSISKKDLE